MNTKQLSFRTLPVQADLAPLVAHAPQLVLAFGPPHYFNDENLSLQLKTAFPQTLLIGASSGGNITRDGIEDQALQLTAIKFDDPALAWASVTTEDTNDSFTAGLKLGEKLAPFAPRHLLLFAHRLNTNAHLLLQGIKQALPEVTISGGIASNPLNGSHSFTLDPEGCSENRSVALAFCSSRIQISQGVSCGWRPFGPTRKVTRSRHNTLYELDGEPALLMYQRYLGHLLDDCAYARLLFSFEMLDSNGKETGLIRAVQTTNVPDGSLTLTDDIIEGGYLRLMHANTNALVDGAEAAAEQALSGELSLGNKLALVISCYGRRIVMGQRSEEEIDAILPHLTEEFCVAGYYSQGEYGVPGTRSKECQIMNETMSLTLLGEAPC